MLSMSAPFRLAVLTSFGNSPACRVPTSAMSAAGPAGFGQFTGGDLPPSDLPAVTPAGGVAATAGADDRRMQPGILRRQSGRIRGRVRVAAIRPVILSFHACLSCSLLPGPPAGRRPCSPVVPAVAAAPFQGQWRRQCDPKAQER